LTLDEVLDSVERDYPLLRAVEEERAITGGRLLSAMGAFDTNLRSGSYNIPIGTYENYRLITGIEQPFTTSGVNTFAQYRYGLGDFPVYYGDRKTGEGGEFRAGVSVPLLRDNSIDRRRANLRQARLNREAADPVVDRQRIDFLRAAARTYWGWIAAGERLRLAQHLADLANERDKQLKDLQENKLIARIDRIDNQQNIAGRQAVLVETQLRYQQATIELSLFLRNEQGDPTLPGAERLPRFPGMVPADPKRFEADLEAAFENRPELKRLRLQREAAEVELRLALNQTLPGLNAYVAGSQDMGFGKPRTGPDRLERSTFEMGFEFQVPVQRRDALGRVETARGQVRQIANQEQFQRDSIRAEVQGNFAAVDRAFQLHEQAVLRVQLARQVAEAERQRLKDGDSDVLRVTLREQAAFDAELLEVAAKFEYFRAIADYRAALGLPR
jgi:outer membrane protein TolC